MGTRLDAGTRARARANWNHNAQRRDHVAPEWWPVSDEVLYIQIAIELGLILQQVLYWNGKTAQPQQHRYTATVERWLWFTKAEKKRTAKRPDGYTYNLDPIRKPHRIDPKGRPV